MSAKLRHHFPGEQFHRGRGVGALDARHVHPADHFRWIQLGLVFLDLGDGETGIADDIAALEALEGDAVALFDDLAVIAAQHPVAGRRSGENGEIEGGRLPRRVADREAQRLGVGKIVGRLDRAAMLFA